MKSVLVSTRPKWCEKICHEIGTDKNGKPIYEKSIEVRKTMPSIPTPFKVLLYCTSSNVHDCLLVNEQGASLTYAINYKSAIPVGCEIGNGKVIGEFICDKIEEFSVGSLRSDDIEKLACLSYSEMIDYFYKPEELDGKTGKHGYGWYISQLKIYNTPKELSEFKRPCSYKGLCFSCKRAHFYGDGSFVCTNKVTRPPQSWCYVQELEELEK